MRYQRQNLEDSNHTDSTNHEIETGRIASQTNEQRMSRKTPNPSESKVAPRNEEKEQKILTTEQIQSSLNRVSRLFPEGSRCVSRKLDSRTGHTKYPHWYPSPLVHQISAPRHMFRMATPERFKGTLKTHMGRQTSHGSYPFWHNPYRGLCPGDKRLAGKAVKQCCKANTFPTAQPRLCRDR